MEPGLFIYFEGLDAGPPAKENGQDRHRQTDRQTQTDTDRQTDRGLTIRKGIRTCNLLKPMP